MTNWTPAKVAALIERSGLTQRAFCRLYGLRQPTVSDWINAKHPVSRNSALALDHIKLLLDAR